MPEEEKKDAAADAKKDDKPACGEMKKGDYLIHILLEKTKEFKVPKNSTVDPIFEIECLGVKKHSSSKSKIGGLAEISWDEHVFIEPRNVSKQGAEEAKISIKLNDKGFLKDSNIGLFEFDLSFIYFKEGQALFHQWIAFSNPNSEDYSEITGYLKLSVTVAATGDPQVQIPDDDEMGPVAPVMMPPQLNPEFYQLTFRFFQVQEVPPMDMGIPYVTKPKTDAFMQAMYKNKKLKTEVMTYTEGGPYVDWNQEFLMPAQIPIITPRYVLKLMDENLTGADTVGSILFSLKDIIEQKITNKFTWVNIYGSQLHLSSSSHKTEQNENPELATNWKGRVMLQILAEKCEKPIIKVQKIDDEVLMQAKSFLENRSYEVICEIGQAVALPKHKKYTIKIIIGGFVLRTKEPKVQKKNYNRFNERFEQQTLKLPYGNIADMGKVIFLLMDEDHPVCYYMETLAKFTKPDASYNWVSFRPDLAVGRVKEPNDAGMFSFKLSINDVERNGSINFKTFDAWKKSPAKRAIPVTVRAYIYQCRDLPAADASGQSDPYVCCWDMSDKQKKTEVINENLNPLFFQTIDLEYEVRDLNDLESYPPFILDIYDHDDGAFDFADDFLARAIVEPEDCNIHLPKDFEHDKFLEVPPKPRWHPLRFAEGEPECGGILVSFAVAEIDYNFCCPAEQLDLRSRVKFKEMDVNMLILGLRSLQSAGILPVKKAFVQFNFKSLVPPDYQSIQNIQTAPGAAGANPTLNTTMTISIPLPVDPLYIPKLSCTVFDYIYKGFTQPQIGVFYIPMGDILLALIEERTTETAAIDEINQALEKILNEGDYAIKNYDNKKNQLEPIPEIAAPEEDRSLSKSKKVKTGSNGESLIQKTAVNDSDEDDSEFIKKIDKVADKVDKTVQQVKKRKKADPKKAISKQLKNSSISVEGSERLGASESGGLKHALSQKETMMIEIQNIKKGVLTGTLGFESDGNAGFIIKKTPKGTPTSRMLPQTPSKSLADKAFLMQQFQASIEQEQRMQDDERIRSLEELNEQGEDGAKTIIMPAYELDKRLGVDREVDPPPDSLFIGLGWDEDRTTLRRHYRQYFNKELEKVEEVFPEGPSPFDSYDIRRGQSRGAKAGLFSKAAKTDSSGQVSSVQTVGFFKGIIEIESREDKDAYQVRKKELLDKLIWLLKTISKQKLGREIEIVIEELGSAMERRRLDREFRKIDVEHLDITKNLADLESDEIMKRALLAQTPCVVRLYAISAFDVASRDSGSPSDPYLYLKCNNKVVSERDNYQLDEINPKFFKFYDFESVFPGCSPLQIEVYDYDAIFGDDLVGTTFLDLEDRYFSMGWQSLLEKPVEYRPLYHNSSTMAQGTVKLWVEIIPVLLLPEAKEWDISEKPPEWMEVRVCVLNCDKFQHLDAGGVSDVFFRGYFDSKEETQDTDTHFRNTDGKPDFEYRLIFRIKYPRKDIRFQLQAYDRDIFCNSLMGENAVNLKPMFEDVSLVKASLGLTKDYYKDVLKPTGFMKLDFDSSDATKFWLDMNYKNDKGKIVSRGRVRMQIDVLPVPIAEKNPVGKAQQEPNHSPNLPKPKGRLEFSLNPFKMLAQFLPPAVIRKLVCLCCCAACIGLCIMILPNVLGGIVNKMFLG